MSDPQAPVEASLGLTILCALETALGMPTNLEMPTDALAAALRDAISREFLVVPRSDIEAVDYYVHPSPRESGAMFTDRATAVATAADRGVEVQERPRLAWAPIRPEVPDGS